MEFNFTVEFTFSFNLLHSNRFLAIHNFLHSVQIYISHCRNLLWCNSIVIHILYDNCFFSYSSILFTSSFTYNPIILDGDWIYSFLPVITGYLNPSLIYFEKALWICIYFSTALTGTR